MGVEIVSNCGPRVGLNQAGGSVLANVQALRALAATMVVIVHLNVMGRTWGLAEADTALFASGVDLFFLISGFIMVYTTSRRKTNPVQFFMNRFARVAPLYWIVTLLVIIIAVTCPWMLSGTKASFSHVLKSLLFIPHMREDGSMRPLLFVGWSLNLEMMFYLIFAFTLIIQNIAARVVAGTLVLIGLTLIARIWGASLPAELRFMMQPILLEFALGMIIGSAFPYLPRSPTAGKAAVATIPIALIVLLTVARFPLPIVWPSPALPAAVLLVAALTAERAGFRANVGAAFLLGDASYALYLTHPLVTAGMTKTAEKAGLLVPALIPLLIASTMAAAILVGITAHLLVEKPLSKLTHRWLTSRGETQAQAASNGP